MYKTILKGSYEFDSPYWDNITHNAKVWERVMYKKILKGSYEFDSPYWDNITHNAKVWERVNVQDNSERIV